MKSDNYVVWANNKAKYKEGDIVLFYVDNVNIKAGLIYSFITEPISKEEKSNEELRIANRRNCCGGKGRLIKLGENRFIYDIQSGDDKHIVGESRIISIGLNSINERFKFLENQIDFLGQKIKKTAEILGYE